MKKITYLLAFILICAGAVAYAGNGDQLLTKRVQTERAISESVKKELNSFLENIPVHLEKEHGFNDRSEFAKAEPASIYRIVGVGQDGHPFQTNLYNVVIAVNGEYRSMLSVSETNGTYAIETVGGALMAKELQVFEKLYPAASEHEKIVVNVYARAASFVSNFDVTIPLEEAQLIPLESAKSGLINSTSTRALKSSYTLEEAMEILGVN